MNLTFEIVSGHNEPKPMNDKNTGQVRFYRQHAFADLGGPFPEKIQIQVTEPLAPGRYVGTVPFEVGKYDALEVSPFNTWKVRPAKPEEVRKAV